jgi:hypothetical protein
LFGDVSPSVVTGIIGEELRVHDNLECLLEGVQLHRSACQNIRCPRLLDM